MATEKDKQELPRYIYVGPPLDKKLVRGLGPRYRYSSNTWHYPDRLRKDVRYQEAKKRAFEKLGNKCASCGFNDWRALQIDHKNDDGYAERAYCNEHGGRPLYEAVIQDEVGRYQLLCANCNWIKNFVQRGYTNPNVIFG